jgi:hypothetical protein
MVIHWACCARRVSSKRQRADHWFWDHDPASPRAGREHAGDHGLPHTRTYCPCNDPAGSGRIVCVKARRPAEPRTAPWHAKAMAEDGLSRQMPQVCLWLDSLALLSKHSDPIQP